MLGAKKSGSFSTLQQSRHERRSISGQPDAVANLRGRESVAYVQGESLKVMLPSAGGFELPAAALFAAMRLQKRHLRRLTDE